MISPLHFGLRLRLLSPRLRGLSDMSHDLSVLCQGDGEAVTVDVGCQRIKFGTGVTVAASRAIITYHLFTSYSYLMVGLR